MFAHYHDGNTLYIRELPLSIHPLILKENTIVVIVNIIFRTNQDHVKTSKCRDMACVDVWMCGCVDVWMCGCVDVWMCGCVDVWMCGCVDLGLWIHIPYRFYLKIDCIK